MEGLLIKELSVYEDNRGWLAEIIRDDESAVKPVMSYLSVTRPGLARGPHEHKEQTDYFCFIGKFRIYVWDNREESSTFREQKIVETSGVPTIAVVPPGIVHAYRNIDGKDGLVINLPDRLYRGWGKKEKVDEVRYEDDSSSPYRIEE
ncbi:MAG: dTDP-4-dehydrorhamnose 3,5-epimerase [Nitrospira bacterium SG8_35_4]|nr:MAG: dTDP-4-dehydrorhamnose 3,5-epimerase [Nitrospira bacterium SG8_35_4]